MESMAVHTRAFSFKKAYCAHQNRSIARGSVGLGDLHLTYRGVAMIERFSLDCRKGLVLVLVLLRPLVG